MDIALLARENAAQVAARATEAPAQAPAESPYEDVTDPQPIAGTRKVALIVRDKRSSALYLCTRGVSGSGAKRVHMDALSTLGFVHISDTDTLKEAGFIDQNALKADAERAAKTTAKKAPGK